MTRLSGDNTEIPATGLNPRPVKPTPPIETYKTLGSLALITHSPLSFCVCIPSYLTTFCLGGDCENPYS